MSRSGSHVPALDGLRGLAILAVFVYHVAAQYGAPAMPRWGSWGWMGVDLFFVLSGYLITGILMDTRGQRDYYRAFYVKRALRILPAFIAFMMLLALAAPMRPEEHEQFLRTQPWYWCYAANIALASKGWRALPFETGHLWSLAVEEQFYLVWPVVIALCSRPRTVRRVAVAVIVGCFLLRAGAVAHGAGAVSVYVLPIFRADGLAWGGLLAAMERSRTPGLAERVPYWGLIGGGLLALVILRLGGNANNASPSMALAGYPALAVACVGLVAARPAWLAWAPLRQMGRVSYAFYLWHAPILLVVLRTYPSLSLAAFISLGFGLSLLAALASWILIERPALTLKRRLADGSTPGWNPTLERRAAVRHGA